MEGLTNREFIALLLELDPKAEITTNCGCGITSVDFEFPTIWNPDSRRHERRERPLIAMRTDCRCGWG